MKCMPLAQAEDPVLFGNKTTNLCKAFAAGLAVPCGYGVSKSVVQHFTNGQVDLRDEFQTMLHEFSRVSVRSSVIGEDGEFSSFAGQFTSWLNLSTVEGMQKAIRKIIQSANSKRLSVYKRKKGLSQQEVEVSILIQKMIDSDVAGIMFTHNPITGADERVIEASWGLGESVASGYVSPDRIRMMRSGEIIMYEAGLKDIAIRSSEGEGTVQAALNDETANSPCLLDSQLIQLNELADHCERIFGKPVDVEWAFQRGSLYLLQCRPITGLIK